MTPGNEVRVAEVTQPSGAVAVLRMLPFLLMACVAVVDVLAGPDVGFLPLLSVGPALAAISLRPAPTAVTGGVALVLCSLLGGYDGLLGSRRWFIAIATILGITLTGALASAVRGRRERELAAVTAIAEAAQRVLLHPVPQEAGPLRIAVRYISATASARIGGDLYEVIVTGGNVRLIIGDVQGKGLAAVQTAATVLGAFREAAYDAPDLPSLAASIEVSLRRQATSEEFVTAILAQVTENGSVIEILSCGHPAPLIVSGSSARFAEPRDPGLPFGLTELTTVDREADLVPFGPGDQILFYTDGISEARDKSGAFYEVSGCGPLLDNPTPDAALGQLSTDVIRHVGHELLDDAAMLLISRGPKVPRPRGTQAAAGAAIGPGESDPGTLNGHGGPVTVESA